MNLIAAAVCFILGVASILYLPECLPFPLLIFPLIILGIFFLIVQNRFLANPALLLKIREPFLYLGYCLLIFWLGVIYVTLQSNQILEKKISDELFLKNVLVSGKIASLISYQPNRVRFEFDLETLDGKPSPAGLLVYWYGKLKPLQQDQRWRFWVQLKPPQPAMNPGGFDQAKWLFSKRINAIATVNSYPPPVLLDRKVSHPLHSLRQYLLNQIQTILPPSDERNLVEALTVGNQQNINAKQWQILQATGTNHLVAIAGVHIGFIATFAYWLGNFLWRRSVYLLTFAAAQRAALVISFLAALFYASISGFALPAQRALIMLAVYLVATLFYRNLRLMDVLALAAIMVLIYDPLALLGVSFWLSFGALLLIIYGLQGRKNHNLWWKIGRLQWVLSIGLLPLTLLFFQQGSLTSFIANLLAVPYVGFFVLPFCFLAMLSFLILPFLGKYFLWIAAKTLVVTSMYLAFLADEHFLWRESVVSLPAFICMITGIFWLLAPKGFPGRALGLICFLPVVFPLLPKNDSAASMTLLDTPYNLQAIIQTKNNYWLSFSSQVGEKLWQHRIYPALVDLNVNHVKAIISPLTEWNLRPGITFDERIPVVDKFWCDDDICFQMKKITSERFIFVVDRRLFILPKLTAAEFKANESSWHEAEVLVVNAANVNFFSSPDYSDKKIIVYGNNKKLAEANPDFFVLNALGFIVMKFQHQKTIDVLIRGHEVKHIWF